MNWKAAYLSAACMSVFRYQAYTWLTIIVFLHRAECSFVFVCAISMRVYVCTTGRDFSNRSVRMKRITLARYYTTHRRRPTTAQPLSNATSHVCCLFIEHLVWMLFCVFFIFCIALHLAFNSQYTRVYSFFEIPEYISLISCGVTISVTPPKSLILINIIVLINNCNRISSIHFEWMNLERDDAKWKIYDINIDSEWRDGETFLQYWSTWFRFHLHQLLCVQGFFVHFVNEREIIVLPMTLCRDGYA